MAGRVFISYRRSDDRQAIGRLRDQLAVAFGDSNVFMDVDSIDFGKDFRDAIRYTMAAADAVVVVIGPGFDPARLAQPSDFVRLELLEAFRQRKLVLPVVIEGASIPGPDQLPDGLEDLSFRNAAPLRPDPDFHRDVERVIASLRRAIAVRAPVLLDATKDQVAYDLSDWDRDELTPFFGALDAAGIASGWDHGELLVYAADEKAVDELLDMVAGLQVEPDDGHVASAEDPYD
jgi:TIR domain